MKDKKTNKIILERGSVTLRVGGETIELPDATVSLCMDLSGSCIELYSEGEKRAKMVAEAAAKCPEFLEAFKRSAEE